MLLYISVLLPVDPNFRVGSDLDMICVLSSSNFTIESSRVTFTISTLDKKTYRFDNTSVPVETANDDCVSNVMLSSTNYVQIVNSTVARLTLPNINLTFDRACVKCCAKPADGNRSSCDEQIIAVGCMYSSDVGVVTDFYYVIDGHLFIYVRKE